jgi:hypothetical protein
MAVNYLYHGNKPKTNIGAGIEYDFLPNAPVYANEYFNAVASDFAVFNLDRATTYPNANTVGNGEPFPLSISEVNRHFPAPEGGNENFFRIADGAVSGLPADWFLRSPGTNAGNYVAAVGAKGRISFNSGTDGTVGIRPALWIKYQ